MKVTDMEDILTFDIEADELEIFLADFNEHLQAMEAGILRLERGADADTLNAVFRAAHTLKALAGTVGHHPMAELTHTLETLFDGMREAQSPPTPEVVDELLATVDVLTALRDEIVTGRPSGSDVEVALGRLRTLVGDDGRASSAQDDGVAEHQLTPEQEAQLADCREQALTVLEVEVTTADDAFAPAARLMQAVMALTELGDVIAQCPTLADLANEQENGRLWLILATENDAGAVEGLVSDMSDLATYRVHPFDETQDGPFDSMPSDVEGPQSDSELMREVPPRQVDGAASPASAPSSTGPRTGPSTQLGTGKGLGVAPNPDQTVRISTERLDTLMNLVGELVTDRTRLLQVEKTLQTLNGRAETASALNAMTAHFSRVVDQLQEEVMRARMLPISHLFDKFPRLVRDVARAAGKQVDLVIEGEATELDRSIIEVIGDPLIHLLRNAVDHGIEAPEDRESAGKPPAGTVRLTAAPVEGQIVVTVEDDGGGIDPAQVRQAAVSRGVLTQEEVAQLDDGEAINLIFRPNLSTAQEVTEVSGRGVGMDVVRTNVERLGGFIVVESELGRGTTFQVTLPLTLAIVDTMMVALGDTVYAIPLTGIIESLYLEDVTVSTLKGAPAILWRDSVLPLLDLREFFGHASPNGGRGRPNADCGENNPQSVPSVDEFRRGGRNAKPAVVTVAWGKLRAGLVVDNIVGKQEIVVKSFSPVLGQPPGLSGCAILGDASIALIVDIPSLINSAVQARRRRVVT